MKYFLVLLSGLLLGAAGATAGLYYNPLSAPRAAAAPARGWALNYDFPADDAMALTHDGRLGLPYLPPGIAPLWEAALDGLVLSALMLEDPTGTAAFASRVSVPSTDTNLLLRGVIVADHWLITVPGRGSLFVEAHNNLWPLLKDTFIRVTHLRLPWRGPAQYALTAGPGSRDGGEVVGVNGIYAGARGTARETYELERFSAARGIEALRGTLAIELEERADGDTVAESREAVRGAR
jgi:hypothetical protein